MSWIQSVAPEAASGDLAHLYAQVKDPRTGQLDHIMQVHSLHRAGLQAHFELYRAVMRGTGSLPAVERELIALVVSQRNRCRY